MKQVDVVCAGLNVVNFPVGPVDSSLFTRDITPVDPIALYPGGDAANQAIVLSRLGISTALLSIRGNDEFGVIMLKLLQEYGRDIDLSHIVVNSEMATCVCAMVRRPDGQRHFCSHRGAMNTFSLAGQDLSVLDNAKVASIGGLMTMPSFDGGDSALFFRTAKQKGVTTVADTKADTHGIGLDGISETLTHTDYFFPSYDEAAAVSGENDPKRAASVFISRGATNVGIKLGKDGLYFKNSRQEFFMEPIATKVVDTTGAGDNFMAGFIAGLVNGWEVEQCCRFGTATASICVGQVGPNVAVTDFEQVQRHLQQHTPNILI